MEVIIGLLLIALYLWLIYLFFVHVFPIAAVIGSLGISLWMIVNFVHALRLGCEGRLPAAAKDAPTGPEPAFKQYFFRRALLDLTDVIAKNVELNGDAFEQAIRGVQMVMIGKEKEGCLLVITWPLAVVFFAVGIVGLAVAIAVNVTFGAIFAASIVLCVIINLLVMLVVKGWERLVLWTRSFSNHCPKCYYKFLLPVYECDVCHARHRSLLPGTYGIFHRKCKCGARLPTSYLFDRQRLESFCPNCDHRLEGEDPTLRPVLIPVLAGRSAGKTAFHVGLLLRLLERQTQRECAFSFVVANDELEHKAALAMFARGQVLPQTLARVPKALQLDYLLPKESALDSRLPFLGHRNVRLRLHMYDAAGEAYEEDRHFEQLTFLEHCTGIIMLIDPFSIPAVRDSLARDLHSVSPSDANPDDVYARLVEFLEQHGLRRGTRQVKTPLAIVVTKCDAFGLEAVIGLSALRKAQENENRRARKEHRQPGLITMSILVRYWLCRWNLSNFVNNIESHFAECRYFSCSAFGRVPSPQNTTPFVPRGVETPFDWILDTAGIAESPSPVGEHCHSQQYQRKSV